VTKAHLRQELSDDLKKLVSQRSNYLNTFWKKRRTNIGDFDFANSRVDMFKAQEGLQLINMISVCIKEIDLVVASTLDVNSVLIYEAKRLFKKNSSLEYLEDKSTRKLRKIVKDKYLLDIKVKQIKIHIAQLLK